MHNAFADRTSDEESDAGFSQYSEYDTDSDDGRPTHGRPSRRWASHVAERSTTASLTRMVPQFQQQLTPVLNSFETRTLIIRSRDRDVHREHLLHFGIQFGRPNTSAHSTDLRAAQPRVPATTIGIRRGCVVPHSQRDVADIRLTHMLLPHLTERLCRDARGAGPDLCVPPELFVRLDPHPPHRRLLGTGSSDVQGSLFWCVPDSQVAWRPGGSDTHDATEPTLRAPCEHGHTLYKPSQSLAAPETDTTPHQTREHYAAKLMLQVHLPTSRTLSKDVRFRAGDSPDVSWLTELQYVSATQQVSCIVDTSASGYAARCCPKIGDVMSLRELHRPDSAVLGGDAQLLWAFFHEHGPGTFFPVTEATEPAGSPSTMRFGLDPLMGGTVDSAVLPTTDVTIGLDPSRSCALNESMQYTMGLEFVVATRRLSPSVVATGQ